MTYEIEGESKGDERGGRGLLVVVAVIVCECHDDAQRVRHAKEWTLRRFSEARFPRPIQVTLFVPQQ
jgi:hypothetical protein